MSRTRPQPGSQTIPKLPSWTSSSSLLLSSLELRNKKSLRALNTSPPRNPLGPVVQTRQMKRGGEQVVLMQNLAARAGRLVRDAR